MGYMKVWLGWDSGPYETVSLEEYTGAIAAEMPESEYRQYVKVLDAYTQWQDKLRKLREGGNK